MVSLRRTVVAVSGSILLSVLSLSAQGPPAPGTINFAEGHVTLGGQQVVGGDIAASVVNPADTLETAAGRAEVLLTPGVWVRLDENSALRMESVSAQDVKMELLRGTAVVEVDQVDKRRQLDFIEGGADAHLTHSGIYVFNASKPAILVYSGKVRVEDDHRGIGVGQGHELLLSGSTLKAQKFHAAETGADFDWSKQRAGYASQVSEWTAEALIGLDGRPKFTDGWYWSPWFKSWAYLPASGHVSTPFGYGLYAAQAPHTMAPVFADFRN